MVAMLVDGRELQMSVQVEARVVSPLGDDHALIGRGLGQHDGVIVRWSSAHEVV